MKAVEKYNEINKKLFNLKSELEQNVRDLLSERNITSINVGAYIEKMNDEYDSELDVETRIIYDTEELIVTTVTVDGKDIEFVLSSDDGSYGDCLSISQFNVLELFNIAGMLINLFDYADKYQNGKVLADGEDF